jgi:hypothetical protein
MRGTKMKASIEPRNTKPVIVIGIELKCKSDKAYLKDPKIILEGP